MAVADATVRLRVLRPQAGGGYTAVATSHPVAAYAGYPDYWDTILVSLPIRRGDLIGLDCCATPAESYFSAGPATTAFWQPSLDAGSPPPTGEDAVETLLQADIEPSYSFEIREMHPRRAGNFDVQADFPNPGSVTVTGIGRIRGGPMRNLLIPAVFNLKDAGPITLSLGSTRSARRALKRRKTVKARLDLTYTPIHATRTAIGPASSTETRSVRLKR
jgi:hypothetical protein